MLYDDVDTDAAKAQSKSASGWGSSDFDLLQSQLKVKRKSNSSSKHKQKQSSLAPVINLRKDPSDLHFDQRTGKLVDISKNPVMPFLSDPVPSFLGIHDEYDPARPNEYEDVVKRLKRERKELRQQKAMEKNGGEGNQLPISDSDDEEEEEKRKKYGRSGATIAPPQTLVVDTPGGGEQDVKKDDVTGVPAPEVGQTPFGFLGSKVATNIMTKMGFQKGGGLGKAGQGMSMALQVEKTGRRAGKILHEKDFVKKDEPVEVPRDPQMVTNTADLLQSPSKVIVLRNMVSPGDVDEMLEGEVSEECSKYGKVAKCVIFEMPGVVVEEAVRIFVQFERMESAIKGLVDLNGRFFGGRTVRGAFYDYDKFTRLELNGPTQ